MCIRDRPSPEKNNCCRRPYPPRNFHSFLCKKCPKAVVNDLFHSLYHDRNNLISNLDLQANVNKNEVVRLQPCTLPSELRSVVNLLNLSKLHAMQSSLMSGPSNHARSFTIRVYRVIVKNVVRKKFQYSVGDGCVPWDFSFCCSPVYTRQSSSYCTDFLITCRHVR